MMPQTPAASPALFHQMPRTRPANRPAAAIEKAHNLLAACVDNQLQNRKNVLGLDPMTVRTKRVFDMNDRSLRRIMVGLGGRGFGVPRETGFDITAASEVMAILCLASSRADLKARLEAIPAGEPFNLKLSRKGLPLNWPTWVADKNFDIDFHLRHSALPQPGHMDELMKLVSRLHGRLLDRTRPLWEMYLIEGLEGNRFGIYTKIHHALVDGVGGMRLMDLSLARSADDTDTRALWSEQEIEKRVRAKRTLTDGAIIPSRP